MSRSSKVVLSIVLVTIFIMVGYCLFQINQTQRAVLLLAEQFTGESASGTSGSFPAGYNPAANKQDAPDSTATPAPNPTALPATKAPAAAEDEPQGNTVIGFPMEKSGIQRLTVPLSPALQISAAGPLTKAENPVLVKSADEINAV